MKRYWLFCYHDYYPRGGMHDFKGSYKTMEEATSHITGDEWHILDIKTKEITAGNDKPEKINP